jgi:hypothetical protein
VLPVTRSVPVACNKLAVLLCWMFFHACWRNNTNKVLVSLQIGRRSSLCVGYLACALCGQAFAASQGTSLLWGSVISCWGAALQQSNKRGCFAQLQVVFCAVVGCNLCTCPTHPVACAVYLQPPREVSVVSSLFLSHSIHHPQFSRTCLCAACVQALVVTVFVVHAHVRN